MRRPWTLRRHAPAARRGLPLRLVAVAISALLLPGCSSGPSAGAWAASVCEALAPWRSEISTLSDRAQQQMTAKTTPAQAKESLVRLLAGAQAASEAARAKVADAGVPDVDGGSEVAEGFVRSLTAIRDAYGRARAGIEALDAGQEDGFYTRVADVLETLNKEYSRSAPDTSRLKSPGLQRAFDEVPECQ